MALACGVRMRLTASLNSAIICGVTAFLSTPFSLAMALINDPRWSMAAAAITPRESATALRPFCFPGLIFIPALRTGICARSTTAKKSLHR